MTTIGERQQAAYVAAQAADARVQVELQTEQMTLNLGPQHPATHGTLRIVARLDGQQVIAHVGMIRPPAIALLGPDGETRRCVAHEVLLSGGASGAGSGAVPDEGEAAGGGEGALFASGRTEVSVSCAKRSLNPARKLITSKAR